jgi:hypothetical protein
MLYCVTEFSNAEIADLIWKVQLLKYITRDETLPHSVHQSSGRSSSSKNRRNRRPSGFASEFATENFHDGASGGFVAACPARLLITASSSAGSTGFAK